MSVSFPVEMHMRRCAPCRDETDFYVSAFPNDGATRYVRADAIPLSDALAIPEVAALVETARGLHGKVSLVVGTGRMSAEMEAAFGAMGAALAALRNIEGRG